MSLFPFALLALSLTAPDDAGWEKVAVRDGVEVFSRQKAGSPLHEMKATGLVDAPPPKVWRVIRDYAAYPRTMPYVEAVTVEPGEGKALYVYEKLNLPFVDRRDFFIKILDESKWEGGQGYFLSTWSIVEGGPPPGRGVVRLSVNDGYWKLEPREGGRRTFATYYLYLDPGGSIPHWLANRANGTAVPKVFQALRQESAK